MIANRRFSIVWKRSMLSVSVAAAWYMNSRGR